MATLNWTARVNRGGNSPNDGPDAVIENPTAISGGYAFDYVQSDGFTATVKLFGSFGLDAAGQPIGGSVSGITFVSENGTSVYQGFSVATATALSYLNANSNDVFWPMAFSGADRLTGSRFNDDLWGYAGNDTINAGDGDDWLIGGKGNDYLNGGNGVDSVTYHNATSAIHVSLKVQNTAQDAGSEGFDTFISIDNLEGSNFSDRITGSNQRNTLWGMKGHDTLNAGDGDDWLIGGQGNDRLNGGAGMDGVSYDRATAAVQVSLMIQNQAQNTGSDGIDTLIGIEKLEGSKFSDTLTGSRSGDVIRGGNGRDRINGQAGNDTLIGGAGNDGLRGGAGNDVFVFFANQPGHDRIRDFGVSGDDRLDFQKGLFASQAAAFAATVDTAAGVKVSWAGGSVLLENVTKGDLTLADYSIFV